jgi:hypothetical protein
MLRAPTQHQISSLLNRLYRLSADERWSTLGRGRAQACLLEMLVFIIVSTPAEARGATCRERSFAIRRPSSLKSFGSASQFDLEQWLLKEDRAGL